MESIIISARPGDRATGTSRTLLRPARMGKARRVDLRVDHTSKTTRTSEAHRTTWVGQTGEASVCGLNAPCSWIFSDAFREEGVRAVGDSFVLLLASRSHSSDPDLSRGRGRRSGAIVSSWGKHVFEEEQRVEGF